MTSVIWDAIAPIMTSLFWKPIAHQFKSCMGTHVTSCSNCNMCVSHDDDNVFRITDPLWRKSIGHGWIPVTKGWQCNDVFWCWTNSSVAGDLRCYAVTVWWFLVGWEGKQCDVLTDNCVNNSCVHGSCINGLASYACLCVDGWEGQLWVISWGVMIVIGRTRQ